MPRIDSPFDVQWPMLGQRWRDVSFVHWPVDPDALSRRLPRGLEPDVLDGTAWVGLVAFTTTCEVFNAVPLPGPRRYPETNVRTYVRGRDGRDGVWFFSLDVMNSTNVVCGRMLGLRYFRAQQMGVETGAVVQYHGRRCDGVEYDVAVRPLARREPQPFEMFLTGRWSGYAGGRRLLLRVDVEHQPWPLYDAQLERVDQSILAAAGFDVAGRTPVAHYSPGVDARFGFPHLISVGP